jgi:hypothetical protein
MAVGLWVCIAGLSHRLIDWPPQNISTMYAVLAIAVVLAATVAGVHEPPHIPTHVGTLLDAAAATHERYYPDFQYDVEGDHKKAGKQPVENLHRRGTGPHDVLDVTKSTRNPHMANKSLPYPKNVQWLLNMFETGYGIPRSYNDVLPNGQSYWGSKTYLSVGAFNEFGQSTTLNSMIGIQERTLTRFGLNLYDAATWQVALSLWNLADVPTIYEQNILYTGSTGPAGAAGGNPGGLTNIRADAETFKYGGITKTPGNSLKTVTYPGNMTHFNSKQGKPNKTPTKTGPGSMFFRMIAPRYQMTDPMNGNYGNAWKFPWPNYDSTTKWNTFGIIHFNDWKPITGENVWATMLGPMHSLVLRTNNTILNGTKCGNPFRTPQIACDFKKFESTPSSVQLGISIIPALLALQASPGLLYHCPWGAKIFPPDPDEGANVSNENNFSGYASILALETVLLRFTNGTSDSTLSWAAHSITMLREGLDKWFDADTILSAKGQMKDGKQVVPQGGHYNSSGWFPVAMDVVGGLAIDCQTWGLSVMGQKRIDAKYGHGFAHQIWTTAKLYAGYYKGGQLCGVGYTDLANANGSIPVNDIWSAEWTFGAINMAQLMSQAYTEAGDATLAQSFLLDAQSMYNEVTQVWPQGLRFPDGSYVYANKRFFIPWGWFSNPISALCSTAWSVMIERNFDPFHLGGGNKPALTVPPSMSSESMGIEW